MKKLKNLISKSDWYPFLVEEFKKDYMVSLDTFLSKEYLEKEVFPPKEDIFNAFYLTSLKKVKVVIIGQDPYHGDNQAHGLGFSVRKDVKIPPSLRNIYKELNSDLGLNIPLHGYLNKWAEQGVLLLNTILTVQAHEAASHQKKGWEQFTDEVVRVINRERENVIFVLWGNFAQKKALKLIDTKKHHIIKSAHPSPLSASRGFVGSKPFSKINKFIKDNQKKPIDWEID